MNQSTRILPDLTAEAADFGAKLGRVLDPVAMERLSKLHPDGVRVFDIADHHGIGWKDACDVVAAAEASGRMKVRRGPDGVVRFMWMPGTMPPLTGLEKAILRQAQRDLAGGPDEIWITGVAHTLDVSEQAVRHALEFLVFADLLKRVGVGYALTKLGRTEGEV
ncbi:hypothetical protein [Roseibium salinum]|uniref:DprA winged helix domain-containing protein n=1 Tax=Roseibium salinum TaxID=1604349 RepID=A0ABT3R041_9HYPH|nr:hypothetical protein [Roseibium sp. DSM 29163]MCX2722595.1 hypothetical protein [Roseibium sp. DSM 29163]MDN3719452.1 hypothetical protein [Roseibium salinum]